MHKYDGNTGRYVHIPEPTIANDNPSPSGGTWSSGGNEFSHFTGNKDGMPISGGILKNLGGIYSKIDKLGLKTEDFFLYAILYLMYRESGDIEFLLIAGAMLFM